MADKFQVHFFNPDGSSQLETPIPVEAEQAVLAARRLCGSLPAKTGLIQRVIIVDSGDACVFEWIHGQGVVFPPKPE